MKGPVELPVREKNMHNQRPAPPQVEVDFSEYVWMGEELEEFDRKVEEELLEQEFLEAMFEDMLDEEEKDEWYYPGQEPRQNRTLDNQMQALNISENKSSESRVITSSLNPNAPEFIPRNLNMTTASR